MLESKQKIIRNSAKCKLCDDEIESKSRWHYVTCKCGEIFVDGGKDYLRRGAKVFSNFIDTSLPSKEIKRPRVLLWDVETSLNIVSTFSLYPKYINYRNILQDWYVICGSWKFLDDTEVKSVCITDEKARFENEPTDDSQVVKKLRDVLLDADIIVHHNGDKFDIKKLNTRLIYHRLDPLPNKLVTVDTCKEAKRTFSFSSNRLDYLGKYLGVGQKIVPEPDLWTKALAGDKDAIIDVLIYNQRDVELLENVYNAMRPYIKHPNSALFAREDSLCCKDCFSTKIQFRGEQVSRTQLQKRYQCTNCGKWDHITLEEFKNKVQKKEICPTLD
jgi:DNA polymerase III epsilon subunit-like protein